MIHPLTSIFHPGVIIWMHIIRSWSDPQDHMASEEMEGMCPLPEMTTIKVEPAVTIGTAEDTGSQNVAMGPKFILPNRFDMNVCSRFVKSLNEEDSKNIQDQVNSDLEVASVLFKGKVKED